MARDAAAIISVRTREAGARVDWSAFEQVFPGVDRSSVRQRAQKFRGAAGGQDYLNRLEEAWLELWKRHRGTEELPDPHPESTCEFDLVAHINFLRKHVNKHDL